MRKIVALHLGTILLPGVFWITNDENGHYNIDTKRVAHRHLRVHRDFGFNITYKVIADGSLGKMTGNGSYDGLIGLIERNEVDTVTVPYETFIKNPPGHFGPVFAGFPNVIISFREPPKITIEDLLTGANLFDASTYILLVVIPTIWFIIMGIVTSCYSLWNIITMALCHNYCNYAECSKRLLQSGLVLMFLFLEYSFLSAFSTDMAVVQPPKLVETLEDLYLSSLKPVFIKVDNLYVQFMESDATRYSNVWKKVQQCGYEKCLFDVSPNAISNLDFSTPHRDFALVASTVYLPVFVNYICNLFGKDYKHARDEGEGMFISKPFSTVNYAYLINRNSDSALRQRLIEFSYFIIESGYVYKGWKDSAEFMEPVYGCHCPQTLFEEENSDALPEPLALGGLHRVLVTFIIAILFGFLILLMEISLVTLRNQAAPVVIEPDSIDSCESTAEAEEAPLPNE